MLLLYSLFIGMFDVFPRTRDIYRRHYNLGCVDIETLSGHALLSGRTLEERFC